MGQADCLDSSYRVVLEMDSSESPVHGEQKGSAHEGYFESVCYHPLTSLQQRLMKSGGRLVKHARYYWLMPAESYLTKLLFAGMVRRMEALPLPAGYAR